MGKSEATLAECFSSHKDLKSGGVMVVERLRAGAAPRAGAAIGVVVSGIGIRDSGLGFGVGVGFAVGVVGFVCWGWWWWWWWSWPLSFACAMRPNDAQHNSATLHACNTRLS